MNARVVLSTEDGLALDEPAPGRPTAEMLIEAEHRNFAPRSATAWLCGDPPPGRSALDKKRAGQ